MLLTTNIFICSNEVFYQLNHTSNGLEGILHVVDKTKPDCVIVLGFGFNRNIL